MAYPYVLLAFKYYNSPIPVVQTHEVLCSLVRLTGTFVALHCRSCRLSTMARKSAHHIGT